MSKLLLNLVLVFASTSAMAEWAAVGTNDEFTQYVDFATIRQTVNRVKMWDLVDYKTGQKLFENIYLSVKERYEYDCLEDKYRHLNLSFFGGNMGNGEVVLSTGEPDRWMHVEPGTMADIKWKIACGKEKRLRWEYIIP